MIDIASSDGSILAAWVVLGGLVLVQAVVADVAGIRSKHTPGMPVTTGHDDFLFRDFVVLFQVETDEIGVLLFVMDPLAEELHFHKIMKMTLSVARR